ncbi:hypothetical protein [Actinomadura violacea]|uniref:Uncharacterized protein n=1 Tax=Actinomadura violacea TaxID=2819934 RepID=A0ABS3S0B8_9ACTN|nr:hypothetical protein [Actinomadura violacea]MBO2461739.1 hypothetical protein [Actinomadura violacea]
MSPRSPRGEHRAMWIVVGEMAVATAVMAGVFAYQATAGPLTDKAGLLVAGLVLVDVAIVANCVARAFKWLFRA